MASGSFRFEGFELDPANRRLSCGRDNVELNARYLDALALLVRQPGQLITKERFHEEIWRGIPVTDEALTQCIRTLRRQLGDDAASPRFIETVPKHGYRFIAPVEGAAVQRPARPDAVWPDFWRTGIAGTAGGATAGLIGGLIYGFAGTAQPGVGAVSVLLVLVSVTVAVALLGASGVSFGIAAARLAPNSREPWIVAGAAAGGLVVGAIVNLLGRDAFTLLLGHSPGVIAGAGEGLVLGAAVGVAGWLAARNAHSVRRGVALGALSGGTAGAIVSLLGGRLMAGSLDSLVRGFPGSRLRLDPIGALFGESGFGPVSHTVTSSLEGALFGGCVVGAIMLVRRRPGYPAAEAT